MSMDQYPDGDNANTVHLNARLYWNPELGSVNGKVEKAKFCLAYNSYYLKDGQKVIIRPAQAQDSQVMLDYARAIFEEDEFFVTTLDDVSDELNLEKSRERIQKFQGKAGNILLVAEVNGDIIGQIHINNGPRKRIRHVGQIALSILKQYRGIGLGTVLFNCIIDWAKQDELIEKLALGVFANNHRAIGLYKKMGFVEEGRRPREFKIAPNQYLDNLLMYRFVVTVHDNI